MRTVTTHPVEKADDTSVPGTTADSVGMATVKVAKPVASNPVASNPVDSLADSATGDDPATPADPPSALTLLAAARRESFGTSPTLTKVANPSAPAPLAATLADPDETGPTPVVAIPYVAPLQGLQYLPVVGPLLVTPIVTLIHQIPLIGDVLHPFVGYPTALGAPAGTPAPRDVKVVSFDGTQLYVHFFPTSKLSTDGTAPTILDGPGLALPGSTNYLTAKDEFLPNDVIGVGALLDAGYNVVTWDPRGEWNSGGQLEIDSPDFEGRDVSAIISWLATQPEVQIGEARCTRPTHRHGRRLIRRRRSAGRRRHRRPHRRDRADDRLAQPQHVAVQGPGVQEQLGHAADGGPARHVRPTEPGGSIPRRSSATSPAWCRRPTRTCWTDRGPGDLVEKITAPTLLVQGTVDTLFTLQEADENAMALIGNDVPTKVVWFCGGHGACVTSTNDGTMVMGATLNWLDRWVKSDDNVVTGPQFEWVDQHGT